MTVAPIQSPTPGQAVARPDVQAAAAVALAAVAAKLAALTAQPVTPATPSAQGATVDEAVRAAAQRAASRQGSLAPLLADLEQAARNPDLPPPVQAAIRQVLALRTRTDRPPTAADVKQALARSGLFLEAKLPTAAPSAQPAAQDLKAALLVFRQALAAWAAPSQTSPQPAAAPPASSPAAAPSPPPAAQPAVGPQTPAPEVGKSSPPPQASGQGRDQTAASPTPGPATAFAPPPLAAAAPAATTRAPSAPALAQATQPVEIPTGAGLAEQARPIQTLIPPPPAAVRPPPAAPTTPSPPRPELAAPETPAAQLAASPRPLTTDKPPPLQEAGSPPPPYRNGPTRAQPPEAPGLPAQAAPAVVAQRLLQETDAALARQELHQLASLPLASDAVGGGRVDGPKWMFEVPFATPQGSAVAQFEISRDGGGGETYVGPGTATWSARFSFDIEPMGPVHAQVTLTGAKAGVTLWAEREPTLARLRAQEESLNAALRTAAFEPEVAVRPGAPPRPAPVPAPGRFVDRAT